MNPSKPRILIVEDEALIAEDLRDRLEALSYDVVGVVHRAEEVFAVVIETSPDLVLLDIKLKGSMDGITAAERLRSLREVPFVYVTSFADRTTLDRATRTHPFGYLTKPFDERSLAATLQTALSRHRAEAQVKSAKDWLGSILQSIGDAVVVTDASGQITFLNRSGETMTKWPLAQALGRKFTDVFRLVSSDGEPVPSVVAAAMGEDRTLQIQPGTELIDRDGTRVPVADSVAPMRRGPGDDVNGAVVVMRDCSEQARLATMTEKLQGQLEEVRRQQSLVELLESMAHDFGNMLTAAIGAVETCRLMAADGNLATDRLDFAQRVLVDAGAICHRMRAAKPERQLDLADVDAGVLVRDSLAMALAAGADRVVVRQEIVEGLRVRVDRLQMERVLTNMFVNAIEAIGEGPGTVRVRLIVGCLGDPSPTVVLSPAAVTLPHARIEIEDSGCGMDDATRARMFDPMYSTKGRGRGLGLSGALIILKAHGAGLVVDSAPGKGTRVVLQLPLA